MANETAQQMNSDMFDGVQFATYQTEGFSNLEIEQAKESFKHNGYEVKVKEGFMKVKKQTIKK